MVLVGRRIFRRLQLRRRLFAVLGHLQHELLAEFVLRRVRQLLVVALVFLRKPLLWKFVLWQLVLRFLLLPVDRMLRRWRLRRLWNFRLRNFRLWRCVWLGLRTRVWARLLHGRLRHLASRARRLRYDRPNHAPGSKAAADAR